VTSAAAQTPLTLLTNIVDRQISIPFVISDRIFLSSEDAAAVIKLLSKAAVDLNLSRVISELGQAEAIGQHPDPLGDVPEVMPVMRLKVGNYMTPCKTKNLISGSCQS
jgi:DNA-directed RNA polymerase